MSALWIQLMERLGYSRYVVHGSDWGGGIATRMALKDSAHVSGLHLVCGGGAPAPTSAAAAQSPVLADPVTANNISHNGYQELQSTKPQTVGQALSDSPVGLASWILEKWHGWSEHDGDLEKVYTKDELLTNVMIYWVTNSGASSARIYYESRHIPGGIARTPFPGVEGRVTVPTGCAMYPWQLDRRGITMPTAAETRKGAEGRYNLVHFAPMPRGGHFPAIEQPQLWTEDVRTFVRALR
jgi:epoxide hydrolase